LIAFVVERPSAASGGNFDVTKKTIFVYFLKKETIGTDRVGRHL